MSRMLGPNATLVASDLAQRRLSLAQLTRAGQLQQQQLDENARQQKEQQDLVDAFHEATVNGKTDFAKLATDPRVTPDMSLKFQQEAQRQADETKKTELGQTELRNKRLGSLLTMPPEQRAAVYAHARPDIAAALNVPENTLEPDYQRFEAQGIPQLRMAIGQPAETSPAKIQELRQYFPNWDTMSGDERIAGLARIAQAEQTPPKRAPVPGTDIPLPKDVEEQKLRIARAEAAIRNAASGTANNDDAKAIAEGIIAGDQPPVMTGLYRLAGPVRAELSRRGYDLAQAQTDWTATQKHLSTLNGPQQERLRQAITFTRDSIENIEQLYEEWKQAATVAGIKVFNRAALATAKQLPGEAGAIATSLEAQIADLTSELGTVYKGGNSSTDHSLELASKNLSAEWNEETFRKAVTNIRKNLQIRWNSMMTSPAVGVSPGSPYTPDEEQGGARGGGSAGGGSAGGGSSNGLQVKPGGAVEALINRSKNPKQ